MAFVLGAEIAGESNHGPEPARALQHRLGQSRPLNRDGGADVVLPSGLRKHSEAFQLKALVAQGESGRPAYGQVGVGGGGQHGCTSGQGWAIDRSAVTSTLA
jgi:hypothetical protein